VCEFDRPHKEFRYLVSSPRSDQLSDAPFSSFQPGVTCSFQPSFRSEFASAGAGACARTGCSPHEQRSILYLQHIYRPRLPRVDRHRAQGYMEAFSLTV
jgi:hypothetical protein